MKVPKEIKKSIIKAAEYSKKANMHNEKVRKWLEKNNMNNDSVLDPLIDSLETGCDPITFIELLENYSFDEGNDEIY